MMEHVSACWRSELGQDMPIRYLALTDKNVIITHLQVGLFFISYTIVM